MTKSQNTKNEQQKDLCITSEQLTEQFLDDELDDSKLYYFKQKMSEEIEVGKPFALNMVRAMDETYLDWFLIDKILAPVPSYEEWKTSEKYNKHLEEVIKVYERKDKQATETSIAYNELAEENAKLKEIIEKDKKVFAESRMFPTHLMGEDFPVKYDIDKLKELLKRAKWWLNEIVKNHRFTPISTAEKALKDLEELEK